MLNKVKYLMKRLLKKPYVIFVYLGNCGLLNWLSDKLYIQCRYFGYNGRWLNLKIPQRFNEKLQWMKLYYRKNEFVKLVDKAEVKSFVANIIGEEYIIPTIGIWDSYNDINFKRLPNQFVIKTTHDSGGVVLIEDKNKMDYGEVEKKITKSINKSYYKVGREWAYKYVKPRIIVEKFMGSNLQDYKFFCFNGKVRLILVCSERFSEKGLCEDFFDENWSHLDIKRPNHNNYEGEISKPQNLELMIELAEKLSMKEPFIRVDLYQIEGKIYFGELTLYPANAFEGFVPDAWDFKLGEWIELEIIKQDS